MVYFTASQTVASTRGKPAYYAVAVGREPGIYSTWDECEQQVTGFSKNKHKKFSTLGEALTFLKRYGVPIGNTTPNSIESL